MQIDNKLEQEVDLFLQYLSQEKRFSAHTVSNYKRDVTRLRLFCEQQVVTWSDVNAKVIRQFIAHLNRQGLAGRSIQRALSAIRSFYRFLIREDLVESNPAQTIRSPKAEKRLPSSLDVDQVNSLLEHTKQNTFIACRDRAIMELFYSSGLRLAELTDLDLRDVDFYDRLIYVTGKGNKSRVLPIGHQAMLALQAWMNQREAAGIVEQAALFLTRQGRRLGRRAIQKRLRHWGNKHGISDQVYPHRLRHTFASHMLEFSGDLRAVQELLGHADISTTQIYTHIDFHHLARVYDNAHPRARKK